MLSDSFIEAFNARVQVNPNSIKNLTVEQQDKIKSWGTSAENLLKNRELALFIHAYRAELADDLTQLRGHSLDDNTRRIAVANQLSGLEGFVNSLKTAVYQKSQLVKLNQLPTDQI